MSETSTLQRLSKDTLQTLGAHAPPYDRAQLEPRILHIGPGAFFRAHQADYIDRLNALDPRWGVTGLSLRSSSVADALQPQDGLYTLVTLDREISARVIGALIGVHHAGESGAARVFLAPELQLVTLTITEKGYCLDADGNLDTRHPDITADLDDPENPVSAIGWIVYGLSQRYEKGLPAPIILSCDNLPGNGEKLERAVISLARLQDEPLAQWIEDNCLFPSSMVDSITPATDDALRERVADMLGIADSWPIQREAFTDWVIEDTGDRRMPPLDRVGAIFTSDVAAFEQAKLRMLNGAHSTLAYFGLARGFESVAEAMSDADMRAFIDALMGDEIAPTVQAPDSLDLSKYQADLIARFRNPAIVHKLSQIAWDGSKKLPIRILATIADNIEAGRPIEKLAVAVAAWWRFIIRMSRSGAPITDPIADVLSARAKAMHDTATNDISIMLSLDDVFPGTLVKSTVFQAALYEAYNKVLKAEKTNEGEQ